MALKTGDDFIASIKSLGLEANVLGEKTGDLTEHPLVAPSMRSVATTYDCAFSEDDETRNLFRAKSSLTGQEINRFTHLHQSTDDLMSKVKMQRRCANVTCCCYQRCVGWDAANAAFSVTYECDEQHGTDYHQRFREFWKRVQSEDIVVDGAMTDPKGDRSKRPSGQSDPDLFLRVVERKSDGVVIRGAKLHQTGMLNSHEILVMPTLAMREGEEDWAICCAVPTNSDGVRFVLGRQASDRRKLDDQPIDIGNSQYGTHEVMTVFDNVFVPEERIFMNGEIDFSGMFVERFAGYHRQSYGGCKPGLGDILIGATALISRMNGVEKASHIRDKIVEMIHLNETLYCSGIACSALGQPTAAGNYMIDLLLANICKLNVTRFPFEIARLAVDIAGGLIATLPSAADFDNPETGPYIRKYLATVDGVDPIDRVKVLRLIENLVTGPGAVSYLIESIHGAGPPQAQRIMIGRQADIEGKIEKAMKLIGID